MKNSSIPDKFPVFSYYFKTFFYKKTFFTGHLEHLIK